MSPRERVAVLLTAVGAGQVVVAAYGYGGWRAATTVAGAITLAAGVALGLEPAEDTGGGGELRVVPSPEQFDHADGRPLR